MAGPWEKYQAAPEDAATPAVSGKPWEKYKGGGASEGSPAQPLAPEQPLSARSQLNRDLLALNPAERAKKAKELQDQGVPMSHDPNTPILPQEKSVPRGAFDSFTNALAFGYGDELSAMEDSIVRNADYDDQLQERQAASEGFAEEHPYIDGAAHIGGAVAGGVGLAKQGLHLAGRGSTPARKFGLGIAEGAGYGAAHGSGAAESGERLEGALEGGALGAAAGGIATAALSAGQGAVSRYLTRNKIPTTDALKAEADAFYAAARAKNPVFPKEDYAAFAGKLQSALAEEGIDKTIHPKAFRAMQRVLKGSGQNVTFNHTETLRKIADAAAGSIEKPERRLGMIIKNHIDDFVSTNNVFDDVAQGRSAFQKFKKIEALDAAQEKAINRAGSTGSGGNVENAMRQEVRKILDNPSRVRGFTEAEVEAMKQVVRGTSVQNAFRAVGKLSPQGNGLMSALLLGGSIANAPLAVGVGAVGAASKVAAQSGVKKNIAQLRKLVRSGGVLSPEARKLLSPEQQAAIVKVMSGEAGAVTQ